jgi:hypothetical protein
MGLPAARRDAVGARSEAVGQLQVASAVFSIEEGCVFRFRTIAGRSVQI